MITLKGGAWYSDPTAIPVDKLPVLVKDRSTMFLRVLLAFLKESGLIVPKKLTCPHSAAISFWTQTYRLPWPRLDAIDTFLFSLNGAQLVRPIELGAIESLVAPSHWPSL